MGRLIDNMAAIYIIGKSFQFIHVCIFYIESNHLLYNSLTQKNLVKSENVIFIFNHIPFPFFSKINLYIYLKHNV